MCALGPAWAASKSRWRGELAATTSKVKTRGPKDWLRVKLATVIGLTGSRGRG
jgi:hypothetical protein